MNFRELLYLNLIIGVLGAVSLPAASALVVEEGKRFGMGSTMAVFNVAMSLGLASGPIVSGIIHDFSGLTSVFCFAGIQDIIGIWIAGRLFTA